MKLNWRWFYGCDLRQLTDGELLEAFNWGSNNAPVSRCALIAWKSLKIEYLRRFDSKNN